MPKREPLAESGFGFFAALKEAAGQPTSQERPEEKPGRPRREFCLDWKEQNAGGPQEAPVTSRKRCKTRAPGVAAHFSGSWPERSLSIPSQSFVAAQAAVIVSRSVRVL